MSSSDLYKRLMDKYSGSGGSSNQEETPSNSGGHNQTYQTLMAKYNQNVDGDYVNRFFNDANSLLGKYGNKVGYITGRSIYDQNRSELDDLSTRARILNSHFKKNADRYEDSERILADIASITSDLEKYGTYLKGQQDYFSQFESENDWNWYEKYNGKTTEELTSAVDQLEDGEEKEWLSPLAAAREYEDRKNYDLISGQKEIDDLEAERQKILDEKKSRNAGANGRPYAVGQQDAPDFDSYTTGYGITNNRPYASGLQVQKEETPEDTRLREIDQLISKKKQYLNQAKHIQEINAYDDTVKNADFDQYDDYVESDDALYNWINDLQYREGYENRYRESHKLTFQDSPYTIERKSKFTRSGYDRMNSGEIAIFNYYYAKSGKEAAQKYLDTIQERLNERTAEEMYSTVQDNTAAEIVFGAAAGFNQFGTNVMNNFKFKDDYIAKSAYQIASGMVREDLADNGPKLPEILGGASLGQIAYDAVTTGANMAPSILVGMATGVPVLGTAAMGLSAAGGAYQQALNEGYDKNQARGYSILVGASEAVMERVLGGISAVGGNALGINAVKNIANADKALWAIAKRIGGSALSEFGEEYLQEVLDPVFSNIMLKTDKEVKPISAEALYSGILGLLTGAIMESPSAIYGEAQTASTGRKIKEAGGVDSLAKIGNTFAADTVAYKLAGKVNENTGAYTIGQLLKEVDATLTEQNVSEISEALMKEGVGEIAAKKYAQAFAYVVEGGAMPDSMVNAIEADTVLAKAAREVLIDSNTTWNQRTQGYNEVLRKLAMDKVTGKKSAKAAPANDQQMTGKSTSEESTVVENENAPSGAQTVEGRDIHTGTQESVSTDKIKSITKDGVVFAQEDGSEVSSKDVAYADAEDGLIFEAFTEMRELGTDAANEIISIRRKAGGSGQLFANVMRIAYEYGYANLSESGLLAKTYHGNIPNGAVQRIYQIGKEARAAEDARRAQAKKSIVGGKAEVYRLTETGEVKQLGEGKEALKVLAVNERKSVGVKTAQFLQKIGVGGNYYFIQSYTDKDGKQLFVDRNGNVRDAHNGMYYSNGDIYIDLNAEVGSSGITLFTISHELAHFVQQWNSEKYKVLADFLAKHYAKNGASAYRAIKIKQQTLSEKRGTKVSFEEAYHEFVADSLSTMFSDGNIYEKLLDLKKTDKSVFDKIRSYINKLAQKAKAYYSGEIAPTTEGQFMQMQSNETIDQLQQLFADALVGASENYRDELNVGEDSVAVNQNGDPVAHATEDGSVQLSMSTYETDGRNAFRKYLQKCVTSNKLTKAEMQDMMDGIEDIYQICKEFKDKYAPFSAWSDAAVIRDTHGRPVFSVVTPNGDYKMNLDFSLVCKKRRTLDAVFNEMSRRGIIDDFELGQKSVVKINEIIRKHGLETACALCFVDAKRFRQASMADSFTTLYNELVESLVPEDRKSSINYFNFSGYETIRKVDGGIDTWANADMDFSHINHVLKTYGEGTVEYKAAKYIKNNPAGRKLLLRGDFMSSKGFDAVKTQNQDILKLYNSKKGTGGPKAAFGDVQYMNEIIKKARTWTPSKAYAVGGVRIQSFSDYVPRMVFDYVQMIYDLAATKLPAHAYSKEALFVKQFGLTGIKINMSLIPAIAEGGIAAGLDANGNYVWAGESFDFETAKQIQNAEGYTENCGTICVGVSDRHIRKLLSDPDIRMVVPYHKSGLNPIVAHMNKIAEFTDYTKKQNTTVKGTGAKAEKNFDFNKALHDMGENADPKAVIQQYFDWCDNNGYDPKFADFRDHPNYYKLIEDFTLYDKDGKYVPQREVRAAFPKETDAFGSMKDLIKEGLEEDAIVEGKRDMNLGSIVDEIQRTIPKTEAEIAETQVEQADRDLEAEIQYSDKENPYYGKTLYKDGEVYDYDFMVALHDMEVHSMPPLSSVKNASHVDQNKAVRLGLENASSIGREVADGLYAIKNAYTGREILLGQSGLEHGLDGRDVGRLRTNARLSAIGGLIVQNAVPVNGLKNKNRQANGTYAMACLLRSGDRDVVAIVTVEEHTSKAVDIDYVDITHSINGRLRKNSEGSLSSTRETGYGLTAAPNAATFKVSIAEFLEIVNETHRSILSQDVLNHFGEGRPSDGHYADRVLFSNRDTESVSNRSLLANAMESLAKTDLEKKKILEYKEKIDQINAEEQKLSEVRAQIKELSFAKGPRDKEKLRALRDEAIKLSHHIGIYDKQLLRLEASKPLQNVLDREKAKAYQRGKEKGEAALKEYKQKAMTEQEQMKKRYEESRKRSVENRNKTAMRHKIQNVVKELSSLLLTNDKKRRVPDNLKKAVADALDLVNMDTVDAENRAAKYADLIAKEQAKENPDQDKIDSYTMTMENILRQGEKMGQRIKELHAAYEEIQNSDDPDIANAYDPVIAGAIQELSATIGNTSIKNMTMEQLSDVYDVYRAVLTRVRDANKAMAENIRASIEELAKSTIREVQTVGGSKKYRISNLDAVRKFDWNNLKPVYAMERIGSSTLTEVFNNVRAGEDTWAKDVSEAREYYLEKSKKYGYDKWDFDKKYRFESNSGIPFELTLEQILSLYAYSKREQAADHLRLGGFVFDSNIETYKEKDGKKSLLKYKVNTADAHQITPEIMADIIGKLSKEQTGFVDEMQDYLSTVMGAKGNEVTSKMYGVKLFKEKFYFPLKSAKQFMFEQNEVSGEVRIKNSGFTNKVVAKANNPVILSNFMDVWSGHVNDMSMYHAFTLPLEDFNRVFNYNSPKRDGVESVSVKGTIQDAYSPAAVSYVKQLITDLNGGARTDSTTGVINKLTGMFKKGAVFASLSVVVQQPSAIARAAALVDTKYFFGPKVDQKRHKYLWEEVKKHAPVAIIKEMGYFDTNMGKSTQDFITGKEYSGIGEKAKAAVTDSAYRDELLSKAPALADEYAWCGIWAAVKRETKAKHPSMDTTSEAFLNLAGKRFTEVITKTQVYDSVLARSANMRSKDTGMKMATAFMAEPTTSINMIEDALWKAKRGDKKYVRKAIGAVIASQILNAILVSFVYAGRDDDEDETYAEKYIGALTGSLVDGLNVATYIPFIKDIVSITQGYDVERSDMAVVSDLWNAWKNLKNDKVSPYRKVENFAGSIAQIFGLPVKNIMRDVRAFWQTVVDPIVDKQNGIEREKTTGSGVKYAISGAITGKTVSDKEQLYKARLDGDKQHAARVAARYDDEDSANSAVLAAIKDAFKDGDIDEATATKHMVLYAGKDGSEAHWTMDEWKYQIEKGTSDGYSRYNKIYDAIKNGKSISAAVKEFTSNGYEEKDVLSEVKGNIGEWYRKGEITKQEATSMLGKNFDLDSEEVEDTVKKWSSKVDTGIAYDDIKEEYMDGNITSAKAIDMYVKYGGYDREEAEEKIAGYDFENEYGFAYGDRKEAYLDGKVSRAVLTDILVDHGYNEDDADAQVDVYEWQEEGLDDISIKAVQTYRTWAEPAGIPKAVYYSYWKFDNATENDRDPITGKVINGTAVKKIMAYINSLNLTDAQKDALAKCAGWKDSTIKKNKLW